MDFNLNYFRSPGFQETTWFDEGPPVVVKATVTSGCMDTTQIDQFRQGVELTQQKYFDAGMAKIHAGEPGHALRKANLGQDKNFYYDPRFADVNVFDPIKFMEAQEHLAYLDAPIFSFPIVTGDSDQLEAYDFNGVIEPLTIRSVAAFYSIEAPFESHSVKGSMMGGNEDQTIASEQVVTVDYFDPKSEIVEYVDNVDMFNDQIPMHGYFRWHKVPLKPFNDVRNIDIETRMFKPAIIRSRPFTMPLMMWTSVLSVQFWIMNPIPTVSTLTITFFLTVVTQEAIVSAINDAAASQLGFPVAHAMSDGSIEIRSLAAGSIAKLLVTAAPGGSSYIGFEVDDVAYGSGLWDADLANGLSIMSGSTDNYVSSIQRSQATGWEYDTTAAVGVDSIAFGGMTF